MSAQIRDERTGVHQAMVQAAGRCYAAQSLIYQAFAIADDMVRSDIELYAAVHGFEEGGGTIYDTRRVASDGPDLDDHGTVRRALAYIDARGDVFPWRLKRYIDAPHLVRFEEKTDGDH